MEKMDAMSTSSFACPAYAVTNTNSADQNYAYCSFTACGGSLLSVAGCGACTGNQYLQLYTQSSEGSAMYLAANDDGCGISGSCSTVTYAVPGLSTVCSLYTVHEGCYGSSTCGGTVTVTGGSSGVLYSGVTGTATTPEPIISPTFSPVSTDDIQYVQGYLQYTYFDGSACNGTTTEITGMQTDTCIANNPPASGSFKIQFDDGKWTAL
jgi:hypothetical protein